MGKINTEKNYNDDLIIHYNETNRIQTTEAINIQTNDLEIYDKNFFMNIWQLPLKIWNLMMQ